MCNFKTPLDIKLSLVPKFTAHSTQHTAHSTQHTAHSTQHTAHSTQHTAHSTHEFYALAKTR